MAYVFISGIATSGKTFLANKIAKETGAYLLSTDSLRPGMSQDPKIAPWVYFFKDQDEKSYLLNTSYEQKWQDVVNQSEAFWPTILEAIKEIKKTHLKAIIEGNTILPHLAARDLDFSGVYLLGKSLEQTLERNNAVPRWGATEELQRMEADLFFNYDRPHYREEAEKYGYPTFTNSEEAEKEILKHLSN